MRSCPVTPFPVRRSEDPVVLLAHAGVHEAEPHAVLQMQGDSLDVYLARLRRPLEDTAPGKDGVLRHSASQEAHLRLRPAAHLQPLRAGVRGHPVIVKDPDDCCVEAGADVARKPCPVHFNPSQELSLLSVMPSIAVAGTNISEADEGRLREEYDGGDKIMPLGPSHRASSS